MSHKKLSSSSEALEDTIIVNNKMGITGHEPTKVHFKLGPYCSGGYLEEHRIGSATLRSRKRTPISSKPAHQTVIYTV
jgi:hypothetical protein